MIPSRTAVLALSALLLGRAVKADGGRSNSSSGSDNDDCDDDDDFTGPQSNPAACPTSATPGASAPPAIATPSAISTAPAIPITTPSTSTTPASIGPPLFGDGIRPASLSHGAIAGIAIAGSTYPSDFVLPIGLMSCAVIAFCALFALFLWYGRRKGRIWHKKTQEDIDPEPLSPRPEMRMANEPLVPIFAPSVSSAPSEMHRFLAVRRAEKTGLTPSVPEPVSPVSDPTSLTSLAAEHSAEPAASISHAASEMAVHGSHFSHNHLGQNPMDAGGPGGPPPKYERY
ncbi:hypothetical protein BV25DRAFT_1521635 [Artomyces pyxidatus]|uniref:Uncharacterized protein n=1 Tax=Artomyces pyxidatus TaxID=48021 RepID=A0ACB8TCC7_9AGAM|nr:hypothetical protein BV25DRAFT_1521635 [Artomyces pyxidatus]